MADMDIENMGIKALRELITSAGLSFNDCVEKNDLRERAREAIYLWPSIFESIFHRIRNRDSPSTSCADPDSAF